MRASPPPGLSSARLVSSVQSSSTISAETVAHGAITKQPPSTAYTRLAAVLTSGPSAYAPPSYSEKLGHAPTCTCSSCAYIAYFDSGCRCSQQHRPPSPPRGVSCTARSLPSPSPNTVRSTWVGLSLRRVAIVAPAGPIIHWAI